MFKKNEKIHEMADRNLNSAQWQKRDFIESSKGQAFIHGSFFLLLFYMIPRGGTGKLPLAWREPSLSNTVMQDVR